MADGSIPACAGKPGQPLTLTRSSRVHPRVCGEAANERRNDQPQRGPSPRVRGSRSADRLPERQRGSIPACAGKPHSSIGMRRKTQVHPRVCGEAPCNMIFISGVRAGSIPACAGKPELNWTIRKLPRVHPRVCGEARYWRQAWNRSTGPSPRVRGSPYESVFVHSSEGSIPACAGKPKPSPCAWTPPRVHPRVCGEAVYGISLVG